jgi:hypothetical protein
VVGVTGAAASIDLQYNEDGSFEDQKAQTALLHSSWRLSTYYPGDYEANKVFAPFSGAEPKYYLVSKYRKHVGSSKCFFFCFESL